MSEFGRIGKEPILEIEGETYRESDIALMSLSEIHMLSSFCEKPGHLRFIQNNTKNELAKVYIDNILFKI